MKRHGAGERHRWSGGDDRRHSHGQGHETSFPQVIAEMIGIDEEHDRDRAWRYVQNADGHGHLWLAFAGGGWLCHGARHGKDHRQGQEDRGASDGSLRGDVELKDGRVQVAGTDKSVAWGDVTLAAYVPHNYPLEDIEPGLEETAFYDPSNFTYPAGPMPARSKWTRTPARSPSSGSRRRMTLAI